MFTYLIPLLKTLKIEYRVKYVNLKYALSVLGS